MRSDQQFGSELFLKIAHRYRLDLNFYAALDEAQLGDLYAWLEQMFPAESDPHRGSGKAFWAGPRDSIAHVRDAILTRLVNTGTERGVEVLRRVIAQIADRKWLVYQLLAADQIMRARTWTPLSPREIIRITESPSGVLVQSAQHLAEVLVNAVRKYERELYGEQTPIRDLWDVQANKALRPVDENALSDHVQRFLKRELVESGIILNREVEISRVPGAPSGKRTDIKVDGISRIENSDKVNIITAVIETKGCWNANLLTAIKSQLVDDYLVRLGAPVGIYMVGWFDKQQWDARDSRRSRTRGWTVEEAQRRLDREAAALTQAFIVRATVLNCRAPGS
jgi:hypothetical protein